MKTIYLSKKAGQRVDVEGGWNGGVHSFRAVASGSAKPVSAHVI